MRLPLLLCLTATIACTASEPLVSSQSSAIINGQACTQGELPETAALLVDATMTFQGEIISIRTLMCTATLIAPDVVLTAAHCVDPDALTGGFATLTKIQYYLTFSPDLSAFTQTEPGDMPPLPADAIPLSATTKHSSFALEETAAGLGNFYDIGLGFLERPVTSISPAIVITPAEASSLSVGDDVQIAGWGRQTAEESERIGTKHCAHATIFELGDYEMRIGNEATTSRKCHGDSGGPTYVDVESDSLRKGRVIGATSRAYDSGDCMSGGIDTSAGAWYEWIDEQMSAGCNAETRAWCDVEGVIPADYYDDKITAESGGCSTSQGSAGSSAGLLFLCLLYWRKRD